MQISLQKHLGTFEYSISGWQNSWKWSQTFLKTEGRQEIPSIWGGGGGGKSMLMILKSCL